MTTSTPALYAPGFDAGPIQIENDSHALALLAPVGPRPRPARLGLLGLQRHHAVAGTPKGRLFPLTRDELIECSALLAAVRAGRLDAVKEDLAQRKALDVVTDLVGNHVSLREVPGRSQALLHDIVESGIDVELLVRWTIERPHRGARGDRRERALPGGDRLKAPHLLRVEEPPESSAAAAVTILNVEPGS